MVLFVVGLGVRVVLLVPLFMSVGSLAVPLDMLKVLFGIFGSCPNVFRNGADEGSTAIAESAGGEAGNKFSGLKTVGGVIGAGNRLRTPAMASVTARNLVMINP